MSSGPDDPPASHKLVPAPRDPTVDWICVFSPLMCQIYYACKDAEELGRDLNPGPLTPEPSRVQSEPRVKGNQQLPTFKTLFNKNHKQLKI